MSEDSFGSDSERARRIAEGWMLDPEEIADRERRQREHRTRRRRRVGAFAGAIMAVLVGGAGVVGVVGLLGGDAPSDPGTDSVIATTLPGAMPPPLAEEFSWYAVEATVGFADRIVVGGDGMFYALSTAPGNQFVWPPVKALYASTDGEEWSTEIIDDSLSAQDLAEYNGTVYLIGTAPQNQDLVVSVETSSDQGRSWDSTDLPVIASRPAGGDGGMSNWTHIAASPAGVVAVVQTKWWVDYWQLLPQALLRGPVDIEVVDTGVRVIDYSVVEQLDMECQGVFTNVEDPDTLDEPCRSYFLGETEFEVMAEFTWEDLGLADGGLPEFSEVFVAADGVTFESVPSPFSLGEGLAGLYGTDKGFVAVEWPHTVGPNKPFVWSSTDGREWHEVEGVAVLDHINSVGTTRGRTVIVGQRFGKPVVLWESDDGSFETVDLAESVPDAFVVEGAAWMSAAGVGPLGVVLVIQSDEAGGSQTNVLVGTGPDDWEAAPLEGLIPEGWSYSSWVSVGTDQILAHLSVDSGSGTETLEIVGAAA